MAPQPPQTDAAERAPVLRSIADGLRYVRGNQALVGSFAIDLVAMTFGMPRALFAVLAVSVYDAGAEGTGLLYAAVSAGATVAALTTGWIEHARRLGIIVIWAVVVWGAAIALAGLVGSLVARPPCCSRSPGAADSVSAVCRSAINQIGHARPRCAGACRRSSRSWSPAGRGWATSSPAPSPALAEPALLGRLRRPGLHRRRRP